MISIIGAGGFAREVKAHLLNVNPKAQIEFYVESEFKTLDVKVIEDIDIKSSLVLVAIADPLIRKRITENMPSETKYMTFIHPSAVVLGANVGEGSIICANCTVTVGVSLGKHCHLNPGVTVGHDTVVGDYFTATPGANIAGNCNIESCVYMGTNSCIKQKTNVRENTTIGMGCVVLNDIDISGVYVGNPARRIR
jgi:sugar O-acyltransferase (sialic acid O-acetyltransferase NeuD family)